MNQQFIIHIKTPHDPQQQHHGHAPLRTRHNRTTPQPQATTHKRAPSPHRFCQRGPSPQGWKITTLPTL